MRTYRLSELAENNSGEYVLGSADLRTHACYCVFGILKTRETGRTISPGSGHEEIVCLVQGTVTLSGGGDNFTLGPGEAFYLRGEQQLTMENAGEGDAIYVISGGHSGTNEHHH